MLLQIPSVSSLSRSLSCARVNTHTHPKPSCRQTTSASLSSHWSSQTEPHLPLWNTSTRPSKYSSPPTNRRGRPLPGGGNNSTICMLSRGTRYTLCFLLSSFLLTFWWSTHNSRLVSMATVPGNKCPALALADGALITTATQPLVMEEARARAEPGLLQSSADLTEDTHSLTVETEMLRCYNANLNEEAHTHTNIHTPTTLLPQPQLSADHTGISVCPMRVTHRPPLTIQVHLHTSTS